MKKLSKGMRVKIKNRDDIPPGTITQIELGEFGIRFVSIKLDTKWDDTADIVAQERVVISV